MIKTLIPVGLAHLTSSSNKTASPHSESLREHFSAEVSSEQ